MHWLTRWFGKRAPAVRPARRPRKIQLQLETLEAREVPTVSNPMGGPVLGNVEVQGVYYGQGWTSDPGQVAQHTQLENFLNTIVHSTYMDMLGQKIGYTDAAGNPIGRGSAAPGMTDTSTTLGSVITDGQIQDELKKLINDRNNTDPQKLDFNKLYTVYTPPGVAVSTSIGTSANGSGYHTGFTLTTPSGQQVTIHYAVVTSSADVADVTEVTSHELAEAVTDPDGNGWKDYQIPGPENEIGDLVENRPDHRVYLNGYAVQQMAGKDDLPVMPDGATREAFPQSVAEFGKGVTFAIRGNNRALGWFDAQGGWHLQGATGVDSINVGADGKLDAIFTNGDLKQYDPVQNAFTFLASDVHGVTEGPNGEIFATMGPNLELRMRDANGWHGVGSNGGLVAVGQGVAGIRSLSAGADGTLDAVFNSGTLFQFNIASQQWGSAVPVANVTDVAAGPNGQVFVIVGTGRDRHLDQVTDLKAGTLLDMANSNDVASISMGNDGLLDAVFSDGKLWQNDFTSPWRQLGDNVGVTN